MTKYTLYVDESGDTGLDKVRDGLDDRGASPFLIISGCLVRKSREKELRSLLAEVRAETSKTELHCSKKMNHVQISKFARMVGETAPVLLFSFVSKKETLAGYSEEISGKGQDQKYYNKCVSYFLERVGHAMIEYSISPDELDFVFEERASHDYQKLRNYLRTIQGNPMDKRLGFYLSPIDPDRLKSAKKSDADLLCLADLTAFATLAAINASKANLGAPEQRYLREIKGKFFKDKRTGTIGEFGLKLLKRKSMELDQKTKAFVESWHEEGVEPGLHKLS